MTDEEIEVVTTKTVYDRSGNTVGQAYETMDGQTIVTLQTTTAAANTLIQAAGLETERLYNLQEDKCTPADKRVCDLRIVAGMAVDISEAEGTDIPPKLQEIWNTRQTTERGLREALEEWQYTVDSSRSDEAAGLIEILSQGGN